jgi:hypothetical protein
MMVSYLAERVPGQHIGLQTDDFQPVDSEAQSFTVLLPVQRRAFGSGIGPSGCRVCTPAVRQHRRGLENIQPCAT